MKSVSALFLLAIVPWQTFADEKNVTFTRDVAPILYAHCAECHRPGQVGPFPLLTFKDAARRSRQIKTLTGRGQMPPWHAAPGELQFFDARTLTVEEKATLAAWADSGAKEGDPADLPPFPEFPEGWAMGEPDVILELDEVSLPAGGEDIYKTLVVPIPNDKTRWLVGLDVDPGNRAVVHHLNMTLDKSGEMKKKNTQLDAGFMGISPALLEPIAGMLGAWVPGLRPRLLPEGYGHEIKPGTDLVVQIHYHPTGKPETDQTTVGLYFTDTPTKKIFNFPVKVSPRVNNANLLDIPAGENHHVVKLSREIPFDVKVYAAQAHGHFLLKDFLIEARLPDGKTINLLDIRDWDFNWQERYVYANELQLPKGTQVDVTAIFDNSADNPQNPTDPPVGVSWGPSSTDEMCGAMLVIMPDQQPSPNGGSRPEITSLSGPTVRLPAEGLPIPEDKTLLRDKFDKNKDGRMTQNELDAIPDLLRGSVSQFFQRQLDTVGESGVVTIPEGGIAIPESGTMIREKYDADGDGKLSQAEFDAIPEETRKPISAIIRKRMKSLGGTLIANPGSPNGEAAKPAVPNGSPPSGSKPDPRIPGTGKEEFQFPKEGFLIPDGMTQLKERLDKDRDGRLSEKEFQAAPEAIRSKLLDYFKKNGAPPAPSKPNVPKPTSPEAPGVTPAPPTPASESPPAGEEAFVFPKEGFPIPPEMTQLKERLDKDKNGRLTENEVEAAPESIRTKLLDYLKKNSAPAPPKPPGKLIPPKETTPGKSDPSPAPVHPTDPIPTPGPETFSFPKDGIEIPAEMTQLRERLDTDKDGRLSEKEFKAAPEPIRSNILEYLKKKAVSD